MRISRKLTLAFCSIAVALSLSNCGSKPNRSLTISISPDGKNFVWTLDGKEILSTANLNEVTQTYNAGLLVGRKYKFISKKGEQIEIDVDKFDSSGRHLHATGEHILEIEGTKCTAKAEYTFDDNWFKNIKVTLLPLGTKSSNALVAEGSRP